MSINLLYNSQTETCIAEQFPDRNPSIHSHDATLVPMASRAADKVRRSLDGAMRNGSPRSSTPTSEDESLPTPKYMLLVTAGPSYDPATHKTVAVNADDAVAFENEFMRVKLKVRIRDFVGLPEGSEKTTPYFDDPLHEKDQYSVGFSFVPKVDIPADETVWGNDFDHPVRDRLPPGFNYAFRIVKEFIDPGLSCDAYADKPWLYGPSLSCWFAFRIGDVIGTEGSPADIPQVHEVPALKEGADGSGIEVREDHNLPNDGPARRKFFLKEDNRKGFTFEKGRLYQADFFNPYLDFNSKEL